MKRTFVITENNQKYAIVSCTAIAGCDGGNEDCRQDALYIISLPAKIEQDWTGATTIVGIEYGAEVAENVVFGWDMPENAEDFAKMCDDYSAWESSADTVKIDGTDLSELREQLGGTLGLL